MKSVAIVTAGGVGERMLNNIPKQFITVNDTPIIIYTLLRLQESKHIDRIVIACLKYWKPILHAYCKEYNITKADTIVDGGKTGLESIKHCFEAIGDLDEDVTVTIHDGNRPLVDDETIKNNIAEAKRSGATTTYIDIHDGIIGVDDNLNITDSSLRREHVKSTQTPHCFRYDILKGIFSKLDPVKSSYISMADAAVNLGYTVKPVHGNEFNFKITTRSDLSLFKAILEGAKRK